MRWFGLLGHPLSHSFSRKYFQEKFQQEGITDCEYHLFDIPDLAMLPELLDHNPQIEGFNVTIPYKEAILPYLTQLDETAKAVGAVNTVKVNGNNLTGYNTDVHGFRQSIKPFLEMHHERALILGTGGGAKAVHHVLKQIGIDCRFVSRIAGGKKDHFNYEDVNRYVIEAFPLIINTTPLGMYPLVDRFPPIPYEHITSKHLLYDLVYNPAETGFLEKGKAQGAVTMNGLSMLYAQADKAWEIWNS